MSDEILWGEDYLVTHDGESSMEGFHDISAPESGPPFHVVDCRDLARGKVMS